MSVESSVRLFSAPSIEGDESHQLEIPFPSVSKVIHVAIKTLHIVGVAVFTLLCPYLSIGASTMMFIATASISAKNKSEIAKQRDSQSGFDEATTRRALEAMKESTFLLNFSQVTNAVCISALAISWAVNPIFLVLSTFFLTLNWVISRTESKVYEEMRRTFDEQTQSTNELHKLERIYPEVFDHSPEHVFERIRMLKQEQGLRSQKKEYQHRVRQCVANAWEHLLHIKMFSAEQGLEGDWNIFQPICRLAVIKELELKDLKQTPENIAPSLRKRIFQLQTLRESYQQLAAEEKDQVIAKVLDPEKQISSDILHIVHRINTLATPMMQEQDLFQDPLIYGAESYSLKNFDFVTFLKLQKLKIDHYTEKLFFKAENVPGVVEEVEQQEEEEEPRIQGYLVINGQRLAIRSIQRVQ